jgi:putative ABC transport system permease protein
MNEDQAHNPPELGLRFLAWFCPPALYEGIEGDLCEQFEEDVKTSGARIARRKFVLNVFRFFRPSIILRNRFSTELIHFTMFRNYLTIAYRNVLKNKVFSAINVFGLAIGLAACLLIFQFVSFEWSYDKFHEKSERIYRVTNDRFQNGKLIQHGTIMYPTIGPAMAKDYPEIEAYTRLMPTGQIRNIRIGKELYQAEECHFVDEHFLSVFSFPLLAGEKNSALKSPYSLVLTERTARNFFAVKDDYTSILDKVLYWGNDPQPYKVTGVVADVPENSHIQFDVLVSYATLIRPDNQDADISWTWSDMRHYLVLKPGVDYKSLEAKFPQFSERYFKGDKVSGSVEKFYLQPLLKAHLYSDYEYDVARTASGKAVWAMLIVAGFILVIAWINYINLTTSRALDRAKEVGLRKVMGAFKGQLVRQFIFESVVISIIALVSALIITQLSQSTFNSIIGSKLSLWNVLSGLNSSAMFILVVILLTGILLSGFYPAFVLSSYQPVTVLKGKFQRSSRGQFLRKSLVIFQFTASAALITGTFIVSRQLKYMNEAELGIGITNTMIVDAPELAAWDSTTIQRIENYKHELGQIKGVVSATTSNAFPGVRLGRAFNIRLSDQPSDSRYTMSGMNVDHNFFDTYQVKIVAGRKFVPSDHKQNFQDIKAIILNVNAVKLLGISNPENAIGKELAWGNNGTRLWTIVGVVNDYHQESLKKPMEPMVFRPTYSTYHATSIRLQSGVAETIIPQVENVYKKFFPDNAFRYSFLEDSYRSQYKDDNRFGKIISTFTFLGIVISCLGLIGLSSYTALQRTKEIGIRKVLGASLFSIVSLLSVDFIKLVVIAALLALPIAYFTMDNWLTSYTYRISLEWMTFMVPVFIILSIAALTMSFHVLKTARTNPADTLKYE